MSQSTIHASTSNKSDEQTDDFTDAFTAWRSLAYTLAESPSSSSVGGVTALLPSDTTRITPREGQGALTSVFEQARISFSQRKTAAIRSAFEVANERRSYPPTGPSAGITGMDKWEGTVIEVDDEFFTAQLTPDGDGTEVIADFPRDVIADDDLRIGDVVYVTVRTVQGIGGPKRTSAVRLRRLGRWTEAEINTQKARAKARLSKLESKFA